MWVVDSYNQLLHCGPQYLVAVSTRLNTEVIVGRIVSARSSQRYSNLKMSLFFGFCSPSSAIV